MSFQIGKNINKGKITIFFQFVNLQFSKCVKQENHQ